MGDKIIQFQRDVPHVRPIKRSAEVKTGIDARSSVRDQKNAEGKSTSSHKGADAAELVEKVMKQVDSFSTKIAFSYNPENNQAVILVTEKETGKVIRQIPTEEMVMLLEKMDEIAGIIFNGRA